MPSMSRSDHNKAKKTQTTQTLNVTQQLAISPAMRRIAYIVH